MATLSPTIRSCEMEISDHKKEIDNQGRVNVYSMDPFLPHFYQLPRPPFARVFDSRPQLPFLDHRVMRDLYSYFLAQQCADSDRGPPTFPTECSGLKNDFDRQRETSRNSETCMESSKLFFKNNFSGYGLPHMDGRSFHQNPVDSKLSIFHRNLEQQPNLMSFLYQATGRSVHKPFIELEGKNLWRQFHSFGTEMVITKNGRRMFPLPSFRMFGMELEENYIILMDIVPVDQFRYKFQGASWTIAGRADPEPPQKAFVHPDSPCSGSLWMAKPVSFNRLKLTNHTAEKQGYLVLNSMQKYQPRVHIIKVSENNPGLSPLSTFVFEEMEFMAVTAYQNEKVTQLKIENNPFAKGFRISSDSKTPKKRPGGNWKQKPVKRWSKSDDKELQDGSAQVRNNTINGKETINTLDCSSDSEIDVG